MPNLSWKKELTWPAKRPFVGKVIMPDIKKTIKRIKPLILFYEKMNMAFRSLLYDISPSLLVTYLYYLARNKKLVLDSPKTFEEKLIWLMLYWNHPLKVACTDKYACRAYVEALELGHMLPQLYGVYQNSQQIDFNSLPDKFVLKCTRGSRFNILCKDKSQLDIAAARKLLTRWQRTKFHKIAGEIHYAGIKPLIICEQFLEDESGNPPVDYKMFCFHGKVHCTMVCTGRYSADLRFDYFDREWNKRLLYGSKLAPPDKKIVRPASYEEMVFTAERLSRPFPFVRVDMYDVRGKAYFGEMTFTPNGCIDTGLSDEAQKNMGELIVLPKVRL